MNPFDFPLLADENINPAVIEYLRNNGLNVWSIIDENLIGSSDRQVLEIAYQTGRVVLTHDSDFGWLAIGQGLPIIGIIYLRPGHIRPAFTIGTLNSIEEQNIDVEPPFIIVAERVEDTINIRIRRM